MALVGNLLSFPFHMWGTRRPVLSAHRNIHSNCLATVRISSQSCVQMELFVVVGSTSGWSSLPVLTSSSAVLNSAGAFVGHSYFHNSIPCVRGPGSLGNCWAPFWLELQMRAVSQGTCDAFIISMQTWLWGRSNMNCLFPALGGAAGLCCFPAVPFPTRIADSCESPSLIAQIFSTRKIFSCKLHLCNPRIKG